MPQRMPRDQSRLTAKTKRTFIASAILLAIGLVFSWLIYDSLNERSRQLEESRFHNIVAEGEKIISAQMEMYVEALRGSAGLLVASENVTSDEWKAYVDASDILTRYPGLRGVGIVLPIPNAERESYSQRRRLDNAPDFAIRAVPHVDHVPNSEHAFPIHFIEPIERNASALGLDLASESNRFRAAAIARDLGEPAATLEITLVQDSKKGPGFLVFFPVYDSNFAQETVKDRRLALRAWVYSPVVSEEFFNGVWSSWHGRQNEVTLKVYSGADSDSPTAAYSSPNWREDDTHGSVTQISLLGHPLTLHWSRGEEFPTTNENHAPWMGWATAFLSLMLSALFFNSQRTNDRAKTIAATLTSDLANSETRFEAALESAPNGVVIVDSRSRIVLVNREIERIFGYRRSELLQQDIRRIIPDCSAITQGDASPSEGTSQSHKFQKAQRQIMGRKKDSTAVSLEVGLTPLHLEDGTYTLGSVVDITLRVLNEERLQSTLDAQRAMNESLSTLKARADESNLAKSAFLANMSHEIRTPMNSVLGMSELLERSELTEDQRRYVHALRNAGSSMLDLINGILDLAKVESGHMELEAVAFCPVELFQSAVEMMAVPAHQKGLSILLDIPHALPPSLVGDPLRIRQVIVNLLGNAIKFTESGQVTLKVERRQSKDDVVDFEVGVIDTGIGISQRHISKLFQPFSQVDSSTARMYGGSGLGLAVCDRFVRLMGSEIDVESEEGQGTTFSFRLAFQVDQNPASKALEQVSHRGLDLDGRKALICSADGNLSVLTRSLQQWSVDTEWTSSQDVAAHILAVSAKNQLPDFIIWDIECGDRSALDVIESLDVEGSIAKRSIVNVRTNRRANDIARCRELNLGAWLVKPVRESHLKEALDCIANGTEHHGLFDNQLPLEEELAEQDLPSRILLVDDTEENRFLIRSFLKGSGVEIIEATNGREAVTMCENNAFEVILMDMQMPVMDGYEATRVIREMESKHGTRRAPIIALTADAMVEDRARALKAGCDRHLAKPVTHRDLITAIAHFGLSSDKVTPKDLADTESDLPDADIRDAYLERKLEVARAMIEATASEDFDFIQTESHKIKGTGTGFGFPDLTQIAAKLNEASRDSDREQCGVQAELLQKSIEDSLSLPIGN